jgi:hypothetical protein
MGTGGVELTTHLHLVLRSIMMEVHPRSAIRLHGVVLNWLSTGTTLPFLNLTCCFTRGQNLISHSEEEISLRVPEQRAERLLRSHIQWRRNEESYINRIWTYTTWMINQERWDGLLTEYARRSAYGVCMTVCLRSMHDGGIEMLEYWKQNLHTFEMLDRLERLIKRNTTCKTEKLWYQYRKQIRRL